MNVTEVSEWSNQAADFLVSCSYDQNECDANLDFHPFMHERYGRCITFNSPELNRTRLLSDSLPSAPSGGRQRFGQSNSSSNSEILLGKQRFSIFPMLELTFVCFAMSESHKITKCIQYHSGQDSEH